MTPVLVYPIQHTLGWARVRLPRHLGARQRTGSAHRPHPGRRAGRGHDGRTTGELAERLSTSAQDVSYHTAVLRRAGLLTSVRRSKNMLHTITPAGRTLLGGPQGAPLDV